jgi:DNA-binding NtrC family response regulator
MDSPTAQRGRFVLLIDADPATRAAMRPLLPRYGLELVQARTSVAALELLQRMPDSFRMAVVSLEMPGISGQVLLETLRVFRPGMALMCLTEATIALIGGGTCLSKPVVGSDLRTQMEDALAGKGPSPTQATSANAVARAQAAFSETGSLLDAACEIARGMPGEPAGGW